MESSSQLIGGSEECSRSESGWTTYIVSPPNQDDDDEDRSNVVGDTERDYSDDSLVSDASSGPSHHEQVNEKKDKHDEDDNSSKYCSYRKAYKRTTEKKGDRLRRTKQDEADKHQSLFIRSNAAGSVESGAKVRKNQLDGKNQIST